MGESYRALIVLVGLSIPLFLWLRRRITWSVIDADDYKLRAGLWVGLTIVLFLAQSFWLYMLIVAVLLSTVGRRDSDPPGLYFFLLFLAPPFRSSIEGFAGIRQFLDLDHPRILCLVILLPYAVRLARSPDRVRLFKMTPDKFVFAYIALQLALLAPVTSTTNLARSVVALGIDIALPYYVFSRGLSDWRRLRDASAAFTAAAAVMALIAVFEFFKGWLLYGPLPGTLGVHWGYGHYQVRAGGLRASVSAGHSIVLGYIMMVALGLHLTLKPSYPSARSWFSVLLLLGAGLLAAGSRGPWIGTAVLLTVFAAAGPGAMSRIGKGLVGALVLSPVVAFSPMGPKILGLLPFIGNYDEGSVDYRQQLFNISWDVLMLNPVLGSPYYLANTAMEELRQGEGIIDMVNSYLNIGLSTGFVGLALFAGIFLPNAYRLWKLVAPKAEMASEIRLTGRALLATIVGILVTIATVSGDLTVALVYWCIAGMATAFLRLVATHQQETSQMPQPVRAFWQGNIGRP